MINYSNFIIPSIDLLDGNIVRLYKGDYNHKTIYNVNIEELLVKYKDFPNLHIVDLNGAKGDRMINLSLIEQIRKKFHGIIQLGGGIRSIDTANKILNEICIDRVVLGTVAITNFDLTNKILEQFGREKVILAIDCKWENHQYVPQVNGWVTSYNEAKNLFDVLAQYVNLAKYILVTDISVDGTMNGPNFRLYKHIKDIFPGFVLQASGGVSSIEDVRQLQEITDFAIVGKALYEGLIDEVIC